ncbi:MAG TPA: hypothetical protein K8V84_12975, partial [Nocardiopsis listeri]|uniref:hypothetical protein n=1 Tax=Nocardiopsis listeri TaxID=53440 RepID=UPI001DC257FA
RSNADARSDQNGHKDFLGSVHASFPGDSLQHFSVVLECGIRMRFFGVFQVVAIVVGRFLGMVGTLLSRVVRIACRR